MSDAPRPEDVWTTLRAFTGARIGLGRVGSSLPLAEVLAFQLAHARARDAVHAPVELAGLVHGLGALGVATVEVRSRAALRDAYLRRPDLGRRLDDDSAARLAALRGDGVDVAFVVGDGLSSVAVTRHALPVLERALRYAARAGWRVGPIVLAHQARVALGDEIGALLGARVVAILIGERPGLTFADSLGIYLTYDPRPGTPDAGRNCISNVHAAGLAYDVAAHKLAYLVGEALRRGLSGVALKDESERVPLLPP